MRHAKPMLAIAGVVAIGSTLSLVVLGETDRAVSRGPLEPTSSASRRPNLSLSSAGRAASGRSESRPTRLASSKPLGSELASEGTVPVHAKAASGAASSAAVATASASVARARSSRAAEALDPSSPEARARRERVEKALAKVDWDKTLKDLAASIKAAKASGKRVDIDSFIETAQINLALGEAAKELGLRTPSAALGDPTVRSQIVPSWLGSLGVELQPGQASAIADACLAVPSPQSSHPTTLLEARQAAVQSRQALEDSLSKILTPDQMNAYAAGLASDPLMRPSAPQLNLSAPKPEDLANVVAQCWTKSLQLSPGAQPAAQVLAQQYVASVLAVPPVSSELDPVAKHSAVLDRTNQLVALQQQAEQALASSGSLTPDERTRAAKGSGCCFRLSLAH